MDYANADEPPTVRARRSCQPDAAAACREAFRDRVPAFGRSIVVACLVVANAVHAASNVVQYTHDAAGNIVAIRRVNPAAITIADFTPASGAAGTTVTISGTGFSPATAGNGVTFNGVAASVATATATTLAVTVPANAGTGRIAVTVGGNTAVSGPDFVVTAPGAPAVSGFTPVAGAAGVAVTVTGTNFNPVAGATSVRLNETPAAVSSVSATQLAFAIPAATGSGRIRVTTGAGSALSASDLIVPPAGIAAADVVATTRVVASGAAQSIGIFAAGKYGAILFDGSAGDWLSLQLANFAINPAGGTISYTIYKPDNTKLASGVLSATALSIHVPQLPAAGTYAVLLGTGVAQVSSDVRLELNRVVPVDGAALAVATSIGQTTRMLVAALAGEQKALMISGMSNLPAGTSLDYAIALPNGSTFRKGTVYGLGTTSLWPPFTTSGTHTVLLTPVAATTQSAFRVGLVTGTALPVDGIALDLGVANPGEGARANFAGTAGESLGLGINGVALTPASASNVSFSVYRPDATLLVSGRCFADDTECSANLPNLPATGNYSVIVQPASGATGTMRLWLSRDVRGTLASGTPYGVSLARPGQNGRLAFAGAAGTSIAVQVRGITTMPAGQGILALVNKPDGSMLAYAHVTGAGRTLVVPALPAAGTYTVYVEPEPLGKGAATAQLELLLDPGQSLAVDGPILASTIAVAGGSARYTFAGAAGQNLGLGISGLALSPASNATVSVYKPDGGVLSAVSCSAGAGSCGGNLTNLPTSGTYALVLQPLTGATGGFSVALSTDLAGTLTLGTALPVSLDRPGRNARLTFAATAGQTLRLGWSGVAIAGSAGNAIAYVYNPNGSTLGAASFANGSAGGYDLPALPATGTYTLFVDPPPGATLNATFTLAPR